MSAIGTDVEYTMPVVGGPDPEEAVIEVEWRAYIYKGEAFRIVTTFDDTSAIHCWNLAFDTVPEWVPRPPAKWFVLADEITAQAVRS